MKPLAHSLSPRLLVMLFLCAILSWVAPAHACTSAVTGGTLTAATSQSVYSGPAITGSGSFTFKCVGNIATIASGTPSLTGTLQASVSNLTLKNGANTIPYKIYTTGGYGTQYTGGLVAVNVNSTTLVSLLSGAGGVIPIFIATTPGANIPAGTYTDTLQVTWSPVNLCEGIAVAGLCVGTLNNTPVVQSMTISLTVNNDCTITAPALSFSAAPLVQGFAAVSQNISLLCTKNMVYTVGLGNGSYSSGGRRNMAFGANRLNYDIFKADTTLWGSVGTARANGPAVADGTTVQTIPYVARVYTDQTTPAVGIYSDSVVVDVSF